MRSYVMWWEKSHESKNTPTNTIQRFTLKIVRNLHLIVNLSIFLRQINNVLSTKLLDHFLQVRRKFFSRHIFRSL